MRRGGEGELINQWEGINKVLTYTLLSLHYLRVRWGGQMTEGKVARALKNDRKQARSSPATCTHENERP